MNNIGLYIHVPFCSGKCPYCDFYSVKTTENNIDRYTEYMIRKIKSYKGSCRADTVYFGGGTPSLLGTERMIALLDAARESFGCADEITAEINPESAGRLDFAALKDHGLNRVSIGLQSSIDSELQLLGRRHTAAQAANATALVKSGGIDNISLDLMLGISGQTADSLLESIDFCTNLGAAHISAYILKIEEGTLYNRRRNELNLPDEDAVCDFYELAATALADRGYVQYEISNFSKPGYESRHNLKYWRCEEYLGLGPAAHSFIDGKRFFYGRSMNEFYEDKLHDDGEGGSREEYIALALRLSEGLIFSRYENRFDEKFPSEYLENAKKLLATGLLTITDNNISLTAKGFLCSNAIITEILYN